MSQPNKAGKEDIQDESIDITGYECNLDIRALNHGLKLKKNR